MGILKSYIQRDHTDLNTLRYKDSSTIGNEPIIQKKIPSNLDSSVHSSNGLNRRVDDLKRVGLLMTQPGGIKYLSNEAALFTSKTIASSEPGIKGKLKTIGDGLLNTVKVLGSTLAQVPLNGTGTHFVKGFLPASKKHIGKFETNVRKENRLKYGDPGLTKSRSDYTVTSEFSIDEINKLDPIFNDKIATAKENGSLNDIIKFRFTVVTPDKEVMLPFRAYLDTFSDTFNSEWSSYKYFGRAEDFHTYRGLDRNINLSFKIAAQTREEMAPLYRKIVYLASSVAPTYSSTNLMRGTFVKMTVGSYVYELPGFISNITYSWNPDYPWEIALNKQSQVAGTTTANPDSSQQELPMVLDCSMTFKPIHKFAPQTGLYHYITQDELTGNDSAEKLFFQKPKENLIPSVEIGQGEFGEYGTDGEF